MRRDFFKVRTKADKRRSAYKDGKPDPVARKKGAQTKRWILKHLIIKHGGCCALCGLAVVMTPNHPRQATVDHVIPRSHGGQDLLSNLQLACYECNQIKGNSLPLIRLSGRG